MLKKSLFFFGILSSLALSSAQKPVEQQVAPKEISAENLSPEAKEQAENQEYIQHHLLDSHTFDIMTKKDGTHVGFSLPVIFYDKANGMHFLSGEDFKHGEAVVNDKGANYKLVHEKIYKTDAAGTVLHADAANPEKVTNEKVIDFSITKSVLMVLITSLLMLLIFGSMARNYKKDPVPRGAAKLFEPIVLFVRDDIAKPNIGAKYGKYMPYLLTVFFFILFLNIFGLLPLGINVTGNITITFALALITFILTQVTANGHYWKHIFWMPGVPVPMKIIMMPIELLGVFIKPFALLIRLFANMSAGHIVIMSLIAMIYVFKNWIAGISFPFLAFVIYLLEVLVALLQAYIFTMLSAVYFGMANEDSHHEGEEGAMVVH